MTGAKNSPSCRRRSRSWRRRHRRSGGRCVATIVVLFCVALVWSWWGTIDIVASATGKIVPSGRTKIIQPFETGVVRAIRVQDGQAVKAGDVLVELDPTVNAAERDHLQNDLLAEQLNVARLRAALAAGDDHDGRLRSPCRRGPDPGQHPASAVAQPDHRAPRQDRLARASAGAEGSRTGHDRGHHSQARGDDSGRPATRRYPQDADGKGAELENHLFRDLAAAGRTAGGASRPEQPSARSGSGGGGDPRDARPSGRRIQAILVGRTHKGRAKGRAG